MMKCCVVNCKSNVKQGGHLFPKNASLRRQWLKAINRQDFVPGKWAKICSLQIC